MAADCEPFMEESLKATPAGGGYDAAGLCRMAAQIARKLEGFSRFKLTYRPRICPFHVLMDYVPVGGRVLDIGSGMGLWLLLLSRSGVLGRGTGVEVTADLTEKAQRLAEPRDSLEFLHQDTDQGWPKSDWDCLTMIDVLHHVPRNEQEPFLERIGETGATRIIFKDIDPKAVFGSAMNTLHDLVVSGQKPQYPAPEMIERKLEQMDYRIIASGQVRMLWYPHYYIIADLKPGNILK